MKNFTKQNLRKAIAVAICLAGITMFVQALTPVTIDVSTLGGASVDNSGTPTEALWEYRISSKELIFWSDNGTYTLTGTNPDLSLWIVADKTNITLNRVNITITTNNVSCLLSKDVTFTLIGDNYLKGDDAIIISSGINSVIITSLSGGSLTAKGTTYSGIYNNSPAANLIIDGNADITLEGSSYVIGNITSNIKMSDAAKLTMVNNSASNETNTFERSNATSTATWKLTNVATPDQLSDPVITVIVAAGQTGKVERASTTGINEIATSSQSAIIGYFDMLGKRLQAEPEKGIFIIKYDNGTAKKVVK